jgi:hypothetical protein
MLVAPGESGYIELDFLTIKKTSLIPWKVASEAFDIFSRGKKVPFSGTR